MKPAFSVIFFTTLVGAGQGLYLALFLGEAWLLIQGRTVDHYAFAIFIGIALAFVFVGLAASYFHLGHPERSWRAASQWRTSWLSREVIVLPIFMLVTFVYGLLHLKGAGSELTLGVGLIGVAVCFTLFICTGMIYACLKFLREWHTPLTLLNFTLLGCASGFTIATGLVMAYDIGLENIYFVITLIFFSMALITRSSSLARNQKLRSNVKTTVQTAIGIRHPKITQRSMGMMGGSFNTKEFFHGKTEFFLQRIRLIFITMVFPAPLLLLTIGYFSEQYLYVFAAFAVQYLGLLAERWLFFAEVNHPQNLYYQTIG